MTALAFLSHRGKVWAAGDSCTTDADGNRRYSRDPKVWVQNGFVLGAAGDAGVDRALTAVTWEPTDEWLARRAWGAIRQQCAAHAHKTDEPMDIDAAIGFKGRLYCYTGGDLYAVAGSFVGIGTGGPVVEGFLAASKLPPRERVRAAVLEASRRVDGVGGRIRVVCG